MTTFASQRGAEPFSASSGNVGSLFTTHCHLDGAQTHIFTTILVFVPHILFAPRVFPCLNTLTTVLWASLESRSVSYQIGLMWIWPKLPCFIAALVLVSWGYFIGLIMSVLLPVQYILFLGFFSDSLKQAFILPDDKKKKFVLLMDSLIQSKMIPVSSVQNDSRKKP